MLDPFRPNKAGLHEDFHVLARGWLRYAELFSDADAANAVFFEVAVDLRRKMRSRRLQPVEDQPPPIAGKSPHRERQIGAGNLV